MLILDYIIDEGEMYAEYLRAAGFTVELCRSPDQAFAAIGRLTPDLLVTRLRQAVPGVTGIDVVRHLRDHATTRHIPVVMISSSILAADRNAAYEAACDVYMLLPVIPDELEAEIRRLLGSGPRRRV